MSYYKTWRVSWVGPEIVLFNNLPWVPLKSGNYLEPILHKRNARKRWKDTTVCCNTCSSRYCLISFGLVRVTLDNKAEALISQTQPNAPKITLSSVSFVQTCMWLHNSMAKHWNSAKRIRTLSWVSSHDSTIYGLDLRYCRLWLYAQNWQIVECRTRPLYCKLTRESQPNFNLPIKASHKVMLARLPTPRVK